MIFQLLINFVVILFFTMFIFLNTKKEDWYANEYKDLTFMDSLYLCMTSFSSVGYGDITPSSTKAKIIVVILQIFILLEILSITHYSIDMSLFINIAIILFVLLVATLYFTFVTEDKDWKFPLSSDTNTFFNMFYFTNSTLTTCGYGEIVPVTNKSRIPVMFLQLLIILQVLSVFR
jgi:hypothetical protein